jgi:hypothetical protein
MTEEKKRIAENLGERTCQFQRDADGKKRIVQNYR